MTKPEVEAAFGHRSVTDAAVAAFGTLTGDYARMHFDHHYGREFMGGTIAHGLLSACWAVGALTRYAPDALGVGDPDAILSSCSVRFRRRVEIGDTLCVRRSGEGEGQSAFEMLCQDGSIATTGAVAITRGALPPAPSAWPSEAWQPPTGISYAEDLVERGPRGEGRGRTLSEGEAVRFASEMGETNPLYLNAVFAENSRFGMRLAPPMLCFCLGFSDFLDALLAMPLPSTGFAGHLGDSWQLHEPVALGDTVRGRYRTISCTPSRSRPEMAIVEFGLQLVNQHERVVQQGAISMMVGRRPAA